MSKKKGFTLVELLVVITIIAILTASFAPKVTGYVTKAKKVKQLTYAKILTQVVDTYNMDKEGTSRIGESDKLITLINNNTTIRDEMSLYMDIPNSNNIEGYDVYANWTVAEMRNYADNNIYPATGKYH